MNLQNKSNINKTGQNSYWNNIMGDYARLMKNAYKFSFGKHEQTIQYSLLGRTAASTRFKTYINKPSSELRHREKIILKYV